MVVPVVDALLIKLGERVTDSVTTKVVKPSAVT
jgi:hypothetical protein